MFEAFIRRDLVGGFSTTSSPSPARATLLMRYAVHAVMFTVFAVLVTMTLDRDDDLD